MSVSNRRCISYPFPAGADTSEERELWIVSVPAVDYIRQSFVGALTLLGFEENWDPVSPVAAEYGSEILASLEQIIPPEEVTVPADSEITISPVTMDVAIGNAIAQTIDAAQRNAIYWFQNPAIQSQVTTTSRFMAAGTWAYRITALKNANEGILQFRLNLPGPTAVLTANHDLYNATLLRNQYLTGTFTLTEASQYFIEFATNGKNGSSTGFLTFITLLEMWRTGGVP